MEYGCRSIALVPASVRNACDQVIDYLDLHIDGRPLHECFEGHSPRPDKSIPLLGWCSRGEQEDYLLRLLSKAGPDLPGGRCFLLVCSVCGSPLCGCFSARLRREGDFVVWEELGFQDPTDEIDGVRVFGLEPMVFPGADYHRLLEGLLADLEVQ